MSEAARTHPTQAEKGARFRALHQRDGAFVIPNPWDVGSARLLAGFGFDALATTSAGFAFSLGRRDGGGRVSLEETLAHCRQIVAATPLPVSADFENGFADAPEAVAANVGAAISCGLAGLSIEDATGRDASPIYPFTQACERIAAAVEAAESAPFPFTLTARAENFLFARPDLDDTLRRLEAFSAAGAHVLYAPGLPDLGAITTVCQAVDKPVNVVVGLAGAGYTVAQLADAGVRRISLGSTLARAAIGAVLRGAREICASGSFGFAGEAATFANIDPFLD